MLREVQFPIRVRQAQKLVHKGEVYLSRIGLAIGVGVDPIKDLVLSQLARLASKDPNQLIHAQSSARGSGTSPSSTGEDFRGDCSETGSAMSESNSESSTGQNPTRQADNSPSTALGENDCVGGTADLLQNDQPRDAGVQEGSDSSSIVVSNAPEDSGEGDRAGDSTKPIETGSDGGNTEQPADDRPTHQKKWGKKFDRCEKNSHGGITARLGKDIDHSLLQLCRARLGALVGDNFQKPSARRDYSEFCTRLKTYRNPSPARKEEEGRAVILLMADISGSCSSFSDEALKVAKAASCLGVAGADVLILSHSNGYPEQMEINGKPAFVDFAVDFPEELLFDWYKALLRQYPIEIVIALGDWDAVDIYEYLVNQPQVQRLIWLDNAYCSRGIKDCTKTALSQLSGAKSIKHKLKYIQGCKDAKQFVQNIK